MSEEIQKALEPNGWVAGLIRSAFVEGWATGWATGWGGNYPDYSRAEDEWATSEAKRTMDAALARVQPPPRDFEAEARQRIAKELEARQSHLEICNSGWTRFVSSGGTSNEYTRIPLMDGDMLNHRVVEHMVMHLREGKRIY